MHKGVAVVLWVGHRSCNREVPRSISGGLRWCQEGHQTSNAPVPCYAVEKFEGAGSKQSGDKDGFL